jgi:HSP20 family protein
MATSLKVREERPVDLWRGSGLWDLWRNDRLFSHMGLGFGRLFDDFLGGSFLGSSLAETGGVYSPRIDVKETKGAVKISAEMPGVDEKDIDVSVHDGMLTISGEKKVVKEDDELGYHRIERSYGCFTRDIPLSDMVQTDKIEAKFKNGVLTVTIPKTGKAIKETKKIAVSAG